MIASIVLNDMDRTADAAFGYRCWMLQDIQEPYEVVLNLFNDKKPLFEHLGTGCNPYCAKIMNVLPPPSYFNISAANNLGLHFAKGKYVLFANSDIIYPSNYLRTVIRELSGRRICYSVGSRVNLTAQQTVALSEPLRYDLVNNFDFLVGAENLPGRSLGLCSSPWIIVRDVAEKIGGFDPALLCHEDSDMNDRAMHYLRKKNLQQCLYAIVDIYGYHLSHPPSELYDASIAGKAILEPRRVRLLADPDSDEDTISTNLHSYDDLIKDIINTKPPISARRPKNRIKRLILRFMDLYSLLLIRVRKL